MSFAVPSGYACITTTGGTQLTAYNSNVRDTYTLIGFDWVKTAHYTGAQNWSNLVCYDGDNIVPSSIAVEFVLPAVLIFLAFATVLINMIMGVRR